MKTKLLLAIALLTYSILFSQTWIGGATNTNWSDGDNWSGGVVPLVGGTVLIPTGFNVNLDTPVSIGSLTVEGNSTLNVQNGLTYSSPSIFRQNTTINWFDGNLNAQGGILTNEGTINVLVTNLFDITGSTTLNNLGTINCVAGFIVLGTNSVINNSGTIDFKTDGFEITKSGSAPNTLINTGLIKTSFTNPSEEAFINSQLINTGTIQVEIGTLNLNVSDVNLTGGLYHVSADATLNWNSATTVSGILRGNVFGALNWNDDVLVPTTAVFDFGGNEIINWIGGGALGGGGTLTNLIIINRFGGGTGSIEGATTLDNEGEIRLTDGSNIDIRTNSVLNNNLTGVIDLQVNSSDIVGNPNNVLNNFGLIKVTFPNPTDQSVISTQLNNNNGTIQVDNGALLLNDSNTTFTNGFYNIATGAILRWSLPITATGTLIGTLDGDLSWEGNLIVPTTASFDFVGNGGVLWKSNLLTGGGTLTNNHVITTMAGNNKIIDGGTTLINNAEIRNSNFVRIGTNSTLNNALTGIIDLQISGSSFGTTGSAPHTFINSGLIMTSFPSNASFISAPVNNFGIIEATTAEIDFSNTLINETSGVIRGVGTIDLPTPANFTNNGTFGPGLSPGSLAVLGDYSSTSSTLLDIELNGLTQGTEYDLLAIQGNASFDGDIQITLGFDATVNDEFIVATTTGSINNCTLPLTKIVAFNGSQYEFSIECRNNNELVLTIVNKTLGIENFEDVSYVILYPNPATDLVSFSDDSINNIEVFDINGRKVLSATNGNSFSVKTLAQGLYIVKGTSDNNETITKKLIKN